MSMSHALLREFIKALVLEAAVPVSVAQQKGLALLIKRSGTSTKFILYDPSIYRDFIITQRNNVAKVQDNANGIVAFLSAFPGPPNSCSGAWEIGVSSAKKGFGPMMYDIVMSYVAPAPIMADRSLVMDAAKNVWRFYANRSDVEKIPLDDNDCKTYKDSPELNFAFKATQFVDFNGLVAEHTRFIHELDLQGKTFDVYLVAAAMDFFDTQMGRYK